MKTENKYCIGRPVDGISLNGNEYLLDHKGDIMEFEDRESCLAYIYEYITDMNPEEYVWELTDQAYNGLNKIHNHE